MFRRFNIFLLVAFFLLSGCANQTTPTGGKKDVTPPKLLTAIPADSLKNVRPARIELTFDEYITLTDATKEVQISPILSVQPTVTANNKRVIVKIADTVLETNTTYRISFGSAVRDLHEGNIFNNYTYTFSTGAFFDSLQLKGRVINAASGLADTSGVTLMLYNASDNDSAIVRHKPKYITKVNSAGVFKFKGLPKREFKIYALKDANDNLMYDGTGEMIAFNDKTVTSGDSEQGEIVLALFEEVDTSTKTSADSVKAGLGRVSAGKAKTTATEGFTYATNADTTNPAKRTFDVNNKLTVTFSHIPVLNKDKISLSYDSSGVAVAAAASLLTDTLHPMVLTIATKWLDNTVYTLKLAKGFAKDTSGAEAAPSKNVFRTKEDEDYGKITVHLPGKYNSKKYVLMVMVDADTVYQKPVTDTNIVLAHLRPGKYNFRVIEDRNENGKWDPGNLFGRLQPEVVIPYPNDLQLKAGWENVIDFDQNSPGKKSTDRPGAR